MPKRRLSKVTIFHYWRLFYRSLLFLLVAVWYIWTKIQGIEFSLKGTEKSVLLFIVWCVFMLEMITRFFPLQLESPGSQKQFAGNYIPTGKTEIRIQDNNAVFLVGLIWIFMNAPMGALHMLDILDDGAMILLSLAYSICDIICILFFCPFQTWLLKNRCCSTCRIYNWDYAMMFTPLFFIPAFFSWTLLTASLILLVRWEVTLWLYPERFAPSTNAYLHCENCTEKLCHHKTQLKGFWKDLSQYNKAHIERILLKKK